MQTQKRQRFRRRVRNTRRKRLFKRGGDRNRPIITPAIKSAVQSQKDIKDLKLQGVGPYRLNTATRVIPRKIFNPIGIRPDSYSVVNSHRLSHAKGTKTDIHSKAAIQSMHLRETKNKNKKTSSKNKIGISSENKKGISSKNKKGISSKSEEPIITPPYVKKYTREKAELDHGQANRIFQSDHIRPNSSDREQLKPLSEQVKPLKTIKEHDSNISDITDTETYSNSSQ